MVEEVMRYYRKELTMYQLVFKYMGRTWVQAIIALVIIAAISFVFGDSLIVVPSLFLYLAFTIWIFSCKKGEVITIKYGIELKNKYYIFDIPEFTSYRIGLLKQFLAEKGFGGKEVSCLIEILKSRRQRKTPISYFNFGILLTLILPIWSILIGWIYSLKKDNIDDVLYTTVMLISLVSVVIFVFTVFYFQVKDLLNQEQRHIEELLDLLENIQIEFMLDGQHYGSVTI